MNAKRRQSLFAASRLLDEAKSILETTLDEEDEARDNTPESLQETDRYYESEEASEAMSNAIDSIDEAVSALDEI